MPSADTQDRVVAQAEEAGRLLGDADHLRLLAVARASIAHGLLHGRAASVDSASESPALRSPGAAFVTLELHGQLRGCIGSLEPHGGRSLAADVSENAYAAAFRDPRFAPLGQHELAALHISISVIGPREPIACASESDLLAALSPGVDGLILEAGACRGTFLPSVWEQLPRPADFLRHLKRKAGLAENQWPENLQAWRYRTEYFGE
ncbi:MULTISPECIES: AmmeMemoRadiSam system protein A [Thiorhodovibrio]|uniref:AmmeMemoRadiSam system protein A n=1 Tax=Thiorhodovibrio TaxID=61593 RepID=UPI001F5E09B1|nr:MULTISPECIES: AmmeMemoRadiSam system protein A [Thiorhodovibrio]